MNSACGRRHIELQTVGRAVLYSLFALAFISLAWAGTLDVVQPNSYPTRVAQGPGGKIYVTDARSGSVFKYSVNTASALLKQAWSGMCLP